MEETAGFKCGDGDGDRLSPIVRDALREALRVERNCERLFSVFNPSTPGDAFAVSPEGTPRFSQGGGEARRLEAGARGP